MAKPPLEAAQQKWQQRISILNAAGIPSAKYQQLMERDLQSVQQGGTAMSGDEVKTAILAAAGNQSLIGNPQPSSGLGAILKNIPKDTGNVITGFIPGLVNFIHHLPSETVDTAEAIGAGFGLTSQSEQDRLQKKYGLETNPPRAPGIGNELSQVASNLRNVARLPLANLVPGFGDIADLTTATGRRNLTQHPVNTVLNALPLVQGLGEVAAASKLGSAGGLLGDVSDASTVAHALESGHVGRAALRAGADTTSSALGLIPGRVGDSLARLTDRTAYAQMLSNMGLSSDIAEKIMRPQAIIRRGAEAQVMEISRQIQAMFKGMTEQERALMQWVATHRREEDMYEAPDGSVHAMDHQMRAITRKVAQMNEQWARKGVSQGSLLAVPVPSRRGMVHEYYTPDAPIVDAWKKHESAQTAHQSALDNLSTQADRTRVTEEKLLGKLDKLHRYGEDDATYAARGSELVTIDRIRENLVHPLLNFMTHTDSFNHLVDEWLKSDDTIKSQAATRVLKDKVALTGPHGLIFQLDQALQNRNFRLAGKLTTQIKRIFTTHKSWTNFTDTTRIGEFVTKLRGDLVGIEGKDRSSRFAAQRLTSEYSKLHERIAKRDTTKLAAESARSSFHNQLITAVPARFHPQIIELAQRNLTDRATQLMHGAQLDTALQTIRNSTVMSEMKALFPEGEFDAVMHDSMAEWMKLADSGHDPLWVHTVQPAEFNRLLHPQVLPDKFNEPGMFERKVMNFTPGIMDLAAGLTAAAQQLIEQDAAKLMVEQHVMPFARKLTDLQREYLASANTIKMDPRMDPRHISRADMEREWAPFDPTRYGVKPSASGIREELMIPVGVARSLESMTRGFRPGSQGLARMATWGAYDKTMKVFKYSVLTGPRHLVHVGVAGMLGMMLEDPRSIQHLAEAYRTVHSGKVPFELPQDLYDISTDKLFHLGVGKSLAEHYVQVIGDKAQALRKFEEYIATTYRLASYLSKVGKGVDHEVALDMVHKYFVDLDGMTAPERVILKNVFPFYAFTKYVFRYLLNFPADHPVRAAVLAQFAEQENKDWKSGLPQAYQQLFFLGKQNSKGDVTAIDFKNINPFRSFANDLTMTGFFSQLNPIVTTPFQLAGFNVLNGTGQLYPQIVYDPVSGSLKAKRPSDTIPTLLAQFIPETGAIDHFFTLTQQMKQLKRYSPQAYRSTLFSQLNLPFAWGKVNVPYVQEKQEIDRYKAASAAVTQLEQGGHGLSGYQRVPYNGKIVSAQALQDYWDNLLHALKAAGVDTSTTSPKSILTKPRRPKGF